MFIVEAPAVSIMMNDKETVIVIAKAEKQKLHVEIFNSSINSIISSHVYFRQ